MTGSTLICPSVRDQITTRTRSTDLERLRAKVNLRIVQIFCSHLFGCVGEPKTDLNRSKPILFSLGITGCPGNIPCPRPEHVLGVWQDCGAARRGRRLREIQRPRDRGKRLMNSWFASATGNLLIVMWKVFWLTARRFRSSLGSTTPQASGLSYPQSALERHQRE
jgi:hypothetical protein